MVDARDGCGQLTRYIDVHAPPVSPRNGGDGHMVLSACRHMKPASAMKAISRRASRFSRSSSVSRVST